MRAVISTLPERPRTKRIRIPPLILVAIFHLALPGCGQKGPLLLPQTAEQDGVPVPNGPSDADEEELPEQ